MNAFQILFKSGTSVVVYGKYGSETSMLDEYGMRREDVSAIINIEINTKNETAWVLEHKQAIDQLSINKEKVMAPSQERAAKRQVDVNVLQGRYSQELQSPLTQARMGPP